MADRDIIVRPGTRAMTCLLAAGEALRTHDWPTVIRAAMDLIREQMSREMQVADTLADGAIAAEIHNDRRNRFDTLKEWDLRRLAYVARRSFLVDPRGKRDGEGRWYPNLAWEGGTPVVPGPTREWPWSYEVACRTWRWCRRLPISTARKDAVKALYCGLWFED